MKIKSITLDNFRSYKCKNRFDLTDVNILIGPNNSGKSNLIRSLEIYKDLNLGKHSINQDQRHTAYRENPFSFEIEMLLNQSEINRVNGHNGNFLFRDFFIEELKHEIIFDPFVKKESLYFKNSSGEWICLYLFHKTGNGVTFSVLADTYYTDLNSELIVKNQNVGFTATGFQWLTTQLSKEDNKTSHAINTSLEIMRNYIERWRYLPAFRTISHSVTRSDMPTLSFNGANLVDILNYLQLHQPKKYTSILEMVSAVNPDILNLTAPIRNQETYGLIEEKGKVTIEISEFSTGLQQYVLIITFLLIAEPNSLLMIEEPEQNIHAKAQRLLLNQLENYAKYHAHQIIVTSHSTIFPKVTDSISTYRIEKNEGISRAIRLTESTELKFIKNLLGHENSDLFSYNAVIIVEGQTEEKVLPIIVQYMNEDLVEEGVRVINVGGSGNSKKIEELIKLLQDNDTKIFIILDNHRDSERTVEKFIANKLLKKEYVFSIDKGFEDSFDDNTILSALNEHARDYDFSFIVRNDKPIYENIKKVFFEKTGKPLEKPEFSLSLVEASIKNGTLNKVQIYKHLKQILEYLKNPQP